MAVALTKSGVVVTSGGKVFVGNCGTGHGGFKPGNKCQKGGSGKETKSGAAARTITDEDDADEFGRSIKATRATTFGDVVPYALQEYQNHDYATINGYLRDTPEGRIEAEEVGFDKYGPRSPTSIEGADQMNQRIEMIDEELAASELPEPVRVFRGQDLEPKQVAALKNLIGTREGFSDPAYVSTSLLPSVAERFTEVQAKGETPALFEIDLEAGDHALYINSYSGATGDLRSEMELLLPRDTEFVVKGHSVREIDGTTVDVFQLGLR